jgi:cytosine deaminase
MRVGADVVGGIPAIEDNRQDSKAHVEAVFEIASEFNYAIDVHVDETDDPSSRTLEMVAEATLRAGWEGRVSAAHVCALAAYDNAYAQQVIEKVAAARMTIITNPPVNLVLQGRHDHQPVRRGITRVKELLAAGVNVTCGNDNHRDVFYPFGKADMLEVAYVTALAAHMTSEQELQTVFDMPRFNAAKCAGIRDYGICAGGRANLVLLPVDTIVDALAMKPPRRAVIRDGRIICETMETTKMALPAAQ